MDTALFFSALIITILAAALKYSLNQLKQRKLSEAALSTSLTELQSRFKDVIDLEDFKQKLGTQLSDLQSQIASAQEQSETLSHEAQKLRRQLDIFIGDQTVVDCGLYTPVYDFDISQKYKDALDKIREQQKTSLKAGTAATCHQQWTINGDARAGQKQTNDYIKLMLRAFNGESDAIIANCRWNNVDKMIERLEAVYQAINKLGSTRLTQIERDYFSLKLKELRLSYEYQEKLKAEKDEQRRMQEQIREEERVQKEAERKIRDFEEEEHRSRMALEQAKQQLQQAQGAEISKMNEKIAALEARLAEASAGKERTKSWAEMTKAGNVYIVSNIGSFGENRFKIGMTRREDPHDRVDELGNAAVPFPFDVHAMIRSENARQLEAMLHQRLKDRAVNLVNMRKEFFDVSIDEIAAIIKETNAQIEIIKTPEARDFRQTLVLRQQTSESRTVNQGATVISGTGQVAENMVQQSSADYQVYVIRDGVQVGPMTFESLNQLLAQGEITSDTLLWYNGLTNWIPISQLQNSSSSSQQSVALSS